VLRRDGFTDATTVHDFLTNQVRSDSTSMRQSVIIIDESSLQSTKLGASLLKTAQVHDARVLFVGDARQHVSVEAGDFLRVLEQHSKFRFSQLQDIRRQVPAEYNQAVRLMAGGRTTEGLDRLDQLGWLHERKGDYLRQAAAAYIKATGQCEALDRCIAIAPTWEENHCLTEAIRQELKQRGKLGSSTTLQVHDPLDWTRQQKAQAHNYSPAWSSP
jgi:ATP-dependent exoDNAse (exonuclease V) alpha subunit